MCLGRGFDWLHVPNVALIIGPYSPDLAGAGQGRFADDFEGAGSPGLAGSWFGETVA